VAQKLASDDFVIIGNDIGIKTSSTAHIKSIFRSKYSSWNNGQSVIIVLPSKKNQSAASVSAYFYETTITGVQKFWLSQVFQGRSNPPVFQDTDEEIIRYVEKNPGAIGVIRKSGQTINPAIIINIIN
jgi:ABC-type phosphate transport system substrate-binding protein